MSCSLCALSKCSCQPLCQGLLRCERGRPRCAELSTAPRLARRSGFPLRHQAGIPGLHACMTFCWQRVGTLCVFKKDSSLASLRALNRTQGNVQELCCALSADIGYCAYKMHKYTACLSFCDDGVMRWHVSQRTGILESMHACMYCMYGQCACTSNRCLLFMWLMGIERAH